LASKALEDKDLRRLHTNFIKFGTEFVLAKRENRRILYIPLLDDDREALRKRGLTDDVIDRNGYGSRRGALDVKALPAPLYRIPGLSLSPGGAWRVALDDSRYSGILLPVRDLQGRVQGLKVRLHAPDAEGKMRTFSSERWGGPRGPYAIHCPLDTQALASRVWVVEGELKADVVAAKTGMPTIGLPGVNGEGSRLVELLSTMRAESVGLALDQDKAGWSASLRLISDLCDNYAIGLVTGIPEAREGLDDAWGEVGESQMQRLHHYWRTKLKSDLEQFAYQPLNSYGEGAIVASPSGSSLKDQSKQDGASGAP
jgi:DNA primase